MPEYRPEDLAKASFLYFCKVVLGYKLGAHHLAIAHDLESEMRILFEVARGHGKTYLVSKAYSLWLVYRGWPVDILIVSYSEDQVKFILKLVDDEINSNPHLVHLQPSQRQTWGAQLKTFANGSQIRGEGFGSSVRGAHPTHIIVDDPLKDNAGMGPEDQAKYFFTALSGTAVRGTQIVVIGTPMDAGDLLEQLEVNTSYVSRLFPAIKEDGTALFPELFTVEELRAKEKEIGSFAFAREFMLQRIDPKTQVFADKYMTVMGDDEPYPEFMSVRTIVDPAISEKDTACDSAVVTVGLDAKNHVWELDTKLVHSDDSNKLLWEVYKATLRFHKHQDFAVVWEAELFQKVLAFNWKQLLLERNHNVRTIEVVHEGSKGKHSRILGLQAAWETKAIHLQPKSPLALQFRYYRPNIKGFKIDGIDAFAWVRHPDVNQPYFKHGIIIGGVPEDVME